MHAAVRRPAGLLVLLLACAVSACEQTEPPTAVAKTPRTASLAPASASASPAPPSDSPSRSPAPPRSSPSAAAAAETSLVSVVYDPISGRAELNPPVPVYGPRALKSPGTTRTRANLMAYDADGALLSTTALYSDGPIAPDPVVGDDYGGPSQLFALVRCDPDDVARIDFSIDGHVRSWTATAHAPALTGLRAAVRDGRLRLGWRSADPDGDRVEHTVLLSADAGRTWTPIAYRLRDDQGTDFPLWALPPGDLVFEVVASDGIRYAAERVTVRDVPGTQIHSSR